MRRKLNLGVSFLLPSNLDKQQTREQPAGGNGNNKGGNLTPLFAMEIWATGTIRGVKRTEEVVGCYLLVYKINLEQTLQYHFVTNFGLNFAL